MSYPHAPHPALLTTADDDVSASVERAASLDAVGLADDGCRIIGCDGRAVPLAGTPTGLCVRCVVLELVALVGPWPVREAANEYVAHA